jgi:hypothetical protein
MDIFMIMDKIKEYYNKTVVWVQNNPVKATFIGVFALGFLVGAILF